MKIFKLILMVFFSWAASFVTLYTIAASFASFVTMQNVFDVTEWYEIFRLLLVCFSLLPPACFFIYNSQSGKKED